MIELIRGWKTTQLGAPIDLVCNFDFQKINDASPVLFIGGVHGDEPEGVFLAQRLVAEITAKPELAKIPFLLIPVLNPDGFKNNQRTNGNGVDLNRNFPCSNWSTEFSKERYFPGPQPGSENETQAVVELVLKTKPRLIIHFHSWKPMVVVTADTLIPEGKILADGSGYKLKNSIGYPTPGSLGDWSWLEHKIPVICTEESEGASAEKTWGRFGQALLSIFNGSK